MYLTLPDYGLFLDTEGFSSSDGVMTEFSMFKILTRYIDLRAQENRYENLFYTRIKIPREQSWFNILKGI